MPTKNKALDIIILAEQSILKQDEVSYNILITELKKIIEHPNTELMNMISDISENIDTYLYILTQLESLATTIYVEETTQANSIQQASLIAIPIMFVGDVGSSIRSTIKSKEFNNLLKTFNQTQLCTKEDSVILYNYLCTPDELLNLDISTVHNITSALLFQKDNLLPSFLNQTEDIELLKKDTLVLRYLIGMFISVENNEITNRNSYDENLRMFMEVASNIVASALEVKTLVLLPPYDYFESFRFGLDTYTVTGIKIQIQQTLSKNRIHPHGIKLNINIDKGFIEIISKLENQIIQEVSIDISYSQQPLLVLNELTSQLIMMGAQALDMVVQQNNSIYPVEAFINRLNKNTNTRILH